MPILERLVRFFLAYPLDLFAHLSSLVPIVIGGVQLRTLYPTSRAIWLLFVFFFLRDSVVLTYMLFVPNTFGLQNLEVMLQIPLVGYGFYTTLERPANKRLLILFSGLCLIGTLVAFRTDTLSAASLIIFRLYCMVLSLAYFNKLLTDMRVKRITRHTMFWFATGLFIYATGTFFIFLFSEYIYDPAQTSQAAYDKFLNFNELLVILFALLAGYGLWMNRFEDENSL